MLRGSGLASEAAMARASVWSLFRMMWNATAIARTLRGLNAIASPIPVVIDNTNFRLSSSFA